MRVGKMSWDLPADASGTVAGPLSEGVALPEPVLREEGPGCVPRPLTLLGEGPSFHQLETERAKV